MATITVTPGHTYGTTDTVTSTNLNDLGSPTAALTAGSILTADIADANVTFAKLANIIDDDTMATASDTTLATSESIKAYVDGVVSKSENGYVKLPNGVIMQWGSLTPATRLTDVELPIAFPNSCFNVQSSIGADFTDDGAYEDNSLIWGGYPKDGDLSRIVIMSNLIIGGSTATYKKIFWTAIGY